MGILCKFALQLLTFSRLAVISFKNYEYFLLIKPFWGCQKTYSCVSITLTALNIIRQ